MTNQNDRRIWVKDLKGTYFGDANLDGEFNSADLIAIFVAGEYEDNVSANSTWATGDWNGDCEFTTSDLIIAFQDGGYETGPQAAFSVVPEPRLFVVRMHILFGLWIRRYVKCRQRLSL